MNEDQVDRLIRAIENTGAESWTTWALPIATLILGFVLSQLQEHFARRRAEKQRKEEVLLAKIDEIRRLAIDLTTTRERDIEDRLPDALRSINAAFASLISVNPTGAGWTGRQLRRLLDHPANGTTWSKSEMDVRHDVGAGIATRLDLWRRGIVEEDDFLPEHDAAWDAALRKNTAVRDAEKTYQERKKQRRR